MHNVLTEDVNNIALNADDGKKNTISWFNRNINLRNEQRSII